VLSVALAESFGQEPTLGIISFTVGAQGQRLLRYLLLFLTRQEEPLVSEVSDRMNQADSMKDVVAVENSDVLICDHHHLVADSTVFWHFLEL